MSGIFITVEGGEGVGKSTFCRQLVDAIPGKLGPVKSSGSRLTGSSHRSPTIWLTREPGGSPMADRIRQVFVDPPADDPIFALTELYLVSAARTQHVQSRILPKLKSGEWVLCDRFADSTRVYQGALGGLSQDMIERIIAESTLGVEPHVTFLLDCPAETAMQRIRNAKPVDDRTGASRYDNAKHEMHARMRQAFLALAARESKRFHVLNGELPTSVIVDQALDCLRDRLGKDQPVAVGAP